MSSSPTHAIAVIALACRFPGADSPEAFWHNLATGVESVQEVPATRWPVAQLFAPPPYQPGKSISKWGGFLADIKRFDAAFFNIPADEAQVMDPQQRILLELAYETFERGGYPDQRREGLRIGVFLGVGQNGYSELTVPLLRSGHPTHPMLVAHNIRNLVAGQIAHSLNLTGPALVIDTACSSSLVALHMARQSLLAGDCDLALVGGINLNITATPFVAFSSAGVLAASAHTYVFDERADGFVLGEGGGMVLLSTLDRAATAQDPILGVIRGSAVNNDGRSLGAITPSPGGQEAVLRAAYATAGVPLDSIGYLEAHGTATRIGDVVEARALTRFFPTPPPNGVRYLGSVKPNIGHLLAAASMPSLLKVLLAFQHRQLPPTLHGDQPRTTLKLARAGFMINRTLIDWTPSAPGQPLRAGVSSFGFGGTNAHVILEEPPVNPIQRPTPQTYPFAHTPHWLKTAANVDSAVGPTSAAPPQTPFPIAHSPSKITVDEWLQRVVWSEEPLTDKARAVGCTQWLLLTVATPAAQQCAQMVSSHLQAQGFACTTQLCTAGEGEALDLLLTQTGSAGGVILIGPVGRLQPLATRAALDNGLAQGLFTLQTISQRLLAIPPGERPAGFWVITAGAYAVPPATTLVAPDRAALAGLAFALNDECLDLPCTVVDLPPEDELQGWGATLVAEMKAGPRRQVVAWRTVNGKQIRLTRHLERIPDLTASQRAFTLARKGAYLITGGATGIGAALARTLAAQGVPLLLTGRTPLTRAPERAALVIDLRKQGATVEYVVADVTQPEEVTALFDYGCQLYGSPVGVIHAAGAIQPQPLRSKTRADFQAVLAPKVVGAWLLAQEMQRRAIRPDCFVLFSSIASVLPGLAGGLSDYTAANAFLDALAVTERARGVACTVLNWSVWAETGMGAQPLLLQRLADHGLVGLTSAEGVRAFYQALALTETQVVILKQKAPTHRDQRGERPLRMSAGLAEPHAAASPPATRHPSPATTVPAIEQLLQSMLAAVLKVAPAEVSKTASFIGLGIDSMDALDLVQKLEQQGFHGLPATLFFEYQTISDLAHYLAGQANASLRDDASTTRSPANAPDARRLTFPLSPIQRAFAINHCLDPERPAVAFLRQTLRGKLQTALLQQAVNQVAARHPLLRARFPTAQLGTEQPQQTIWPPDAATTQLVIEVVAHGIATAADLARLEETVVNRPFALEEENPWRIVVAADHRQIDHWHLLLAMHHIIGDAWSLSLVAQELWAFYTALEQGASLVLPMPATTFQAYVADQQNRRLDPATHSWWQQQLTPYATWLPIHLPYAHNPDLLLAEEGERTQHIAHATRLTPAQTTALTTLAAQHNLSLFHLMLAAYMSSLHHWSGSASLLINVADAQRPTHLPGIMQTVGSFADTLPLGLVLDTADSALALAERIRQAWLAIQQYKAVSSIDLARLWAAVRPGNGTGQPRTISPLGFSFARFTAQLPAACPITVDEIFGRTATTATQLSLVGWEYAGALHFSWNYLTPLFRAAMIEALAAHFVREIAQLVAMGEQEAETRETGQQAADGPMTVLLNEPAPVPGQPATTSSSPFIPVHALVQAQCRRTPSGIAVWENGAALTYAELDSRADQVAASLYAQGIAPGATVGLLAQPSTAATILLLGIAKAGAAWVPMDPAHPPARHADQLQQAGTRLVVFPTALADAAQQIQAALAGALEIYPLEALCHHSAPALPTIESPPDALAYIIFTSGSTGRPKGVPITHGALANYIGWAVETFGYGPADRVMQATSLCFDASIRQILAPLVTGGTVIPVAPAQRSDAETLLHFVQQAGITLWSSVPALWARLLDVLEKKVAAGQPVPDLTHLRWVQVGGEALSAHLVRRWFDLYGDQQQIVNLYGPTETTINAAYYIVPGRPAMDETQIPIGYPVRGAQLAVLDEAGHPCPTGVAGELWIGGTGLSPGYLQDDPQTQSRFVQTGTEMRRYRSGDRVQQRADGALLFLGRMDDQVKVRGYRIELGEIEAVLCQQPGVRLATVLVRAHSDTEQELVAYLECATPPTEAALRQGLSALLPAYMIPHHFYWVARLPQMANGKIDRRQLAGGALAAQPLPRTESGARPQTATEHLLARIWQEILHVDTADEPIGREDDFFARGGDSLQALRVFVELAKVRTPLPRAAYLYRYRTLAALAQAIDAYQPEQSNLPIADPLDDHFGVSLAQAGFLLARALQAKQATSWCARFLLEGPLHVDYFRQAVQIVVERHLMLRVYFPAGLRTPQQRAIQLDRPLPVHFTDLQSRHITEQQAAVAARWQALQARQFDPTQWPLIEMHLCRLTPEQHLWFVATDHLIGDGVSGWLLGQELLALHDALVKGRAPTLPPLRSTFRDYVTLQQQHERTSDPAAEAYWRAHFATPYQPPQLRARRQQEPLPDADANATGWVQQSLDLDLRGVQRLEAYAAHAGVTGYEVLLTIFLYQLQELTGQTDLVVGSALTGRDEPLPDIMRIFGAFATALPLRMQLNDAPWQSQVQAVAAAFSAARAHTLSPRRIAHLMHPQTPLTAAIGAQFLFSYMDFTTLGELQSDTLRVRWDQSQTELQPPSGSADLVLTGRKIAGELRLLFTAPAAVLTTQQMQTFVTGFQQALQELGSMQHEFANSTLPGKGRDPFGKAKSLLPPSRQELPAPRRFHAEKRSTLQFTNTPLEHAENAQIKMPLDAALAKMPLDAALIGYLPPFAQIQAMLGASGSHGNADTVRRLLFPEQRPRWLERLATPLGASGLFVIPRFADELALTPVNRLCDDIFQAMAQAASWGARCVALAGMLPAHTRYGYALLESDQAAGLPPLTTGHSTTVVAVVKSVLAALAAVGRPLARCELGCLGLGSIGSTALQLLLTVAGQPAGLTLCDVQGSAARLHALATTLRRELDYQGKVRIIEVDKMLPAEFYQVDLMIGATSRPNVLDVNRLAAGTVVVDDSFPACFDVDRAIERMTTAADVLLVGGGLLHCGSLQRTLYLPIENVTLGKRIAGQVHPDALASCQLEALLWATQPSLPLTQGVATVTGALAYWQAAQQTSILAAPLHLREFQIEASLSRKLQRT